jgi:NAD(P)-dependent dehydrogenase (short-subunit alcohol dehydrogenase family)
MAERTVFVTGATDGLGRALALNIAAKDVRLVVHGSDHAGPYHARPAGSVDGRCGGVRWCCVRERGDRGLGRR